MIRYIQVSIVIAIAILSTISLQADSPRISLHEVHTNASCGPCAAQKPPWIEWLNNDSDANLVVPLTFHGDFPGRNDPMWLHNNQVMRDRKTYTATNAYPSMYVNGRARISPAQVSTFESYLDQDRGTSPIDIVVEMTGEGSSREARVSVTSSEALTGNKYLRIVVVEGIIYDDDAGTNGETEFEFVARNMLPNHQGTALNLGAGEELVVTETFELDPIYTPEEIYIVAFVQDDSNKSVLQVGTSQLPKRAAAATAFSNRYVTATSGAESINTITLENQYDEPLAINSISINNDMSEIPSGWSVEVMSTITEIPANSTVNVDVSVNTDENPGFGWYVLNVVTAGGEEYDGANSNYDISYIMHENLKEAIMFADDDSKKTFDAVKSNVTDFGSNNKVIPNNADLVDIISNFDLANQLDFLAYEETFGTRGILAVTDTYSSLITSMINQGKKVFIAAPLNLAILNNTQNPLNATSINLFSNILKLSLGNLYQTLQNNTVYAMPVIGSSDPVFSGLSLTANRYLQGHLYYTSAFDRITINDMGISTPLMYYNVNTDQDPENTRIAAVGINVGDAKVVYSAVPLILLSDTGERANLINKSIEWMNASGGGGNATIQVASSHNFGEQSSRVVEDIEVTNDGGAELTISGVTSSNPDLFEIVEYDESIAAGATGIIKVAFNPENASDNNQQAANITINSNASNGNVSFTVFGRSSVSNIDDYLVNSGLFSLEVAPNPVESSSNINFTVVTESPEQLELQLMDATGNIVASLFNGTATPGTQTININAAEYAAGKYFLIATMQGHSAQFPVVIVK